MDIRDTVDQLVFSDGTKPVIRIGIHTGPAVAGVIGVKKFSYDVWGDTINVASRMESDGLPHEIQVSSTTYHYLKNQYVFVERGLVDVKGKGQILAYLLKKEK